MNDHELWELIKKTWSVITVKFEPAVHLLCEEIGVDRRIWGLLLAVLKFEPEVTTAADLMIRDPYSSAESYHVRLSSARKKGFLNEVRHGRYRLTAKGKDATERFIRIARIEMAKADPDPVDVSRKLAKMFDSLVQFCLNNPPPPNNWSIGLSYKLMPKNNPPMPYIEQSITCLAAYRDDSHLAAWRRCGLSASGLETLTLLWRGEVDSLDTICEKLNRRGHPCKVYTDALMELRNLGYIDGPDAAPWVTGAGRVYRNQVEEDTDRFFFRPWDKFRNEEKSEMVDNLITLIDLLEA